MLVSKPMEHTLALHDEIPQPLVDGSRELRTAKIPMRERRVHPDLPDLVPPLFRNAEPGTLEEPGVAVGFQIETMNEALRDADVVAGTEPEISEHAPQGSLAASKEEQLVRVAVREVHRVARRRFHRTDDEIGVFEKRH